MRGIKIYAFHGVDPQENKIGSYFTIDLIIKTNFHEAAETDNIEDTISYAEIFDCVKEEMKTSSKLLENVCHRICKSLFNKFNKIEEIEVTLYKENPPMNSDSKEIGINVKYTR